MSDRNSAKRKAKDKAFYIRSAKQQKNSLKELSPGMKGFMCTSNREKDSVREAYNILNEFGDIIYGSEAPKMKKVEDLEIEDELAAEIAELKKQAQPSERRFQSVATGVKGCVFIKTTVSPLSIIFWHILLNLLKCYAISGGSVIVLHETNLEFMILWLR